MHMPSDAILDVAIMWLESNEGQESEACKAVARWIEHEHKERMIREGARKSGVSIAHFRRELARRLGE